jgi:hypothetical protein
MRLPTSRKSFVILSFVLLLVLSIVLALAAEFAGHRSSSHLNPLGAGTSAANDPFWMESIKHQGSAPFNPDPANYQVFRNVKDFGAKGA